MLSMPPKEQWLKCNKRPRRDPSPSAGTSAMPEHSYYSLKSKHIYLRLKNNYRKKITLSGQINKLHTEFLKIKMYPPAVEFKFNNNKNRSEKVQNTWTQALNQWKQKMTKALLDEMFERYSNIKGLISHDFLELEKVLDSKQLQEIRDSLQQRSTNIAPVVSMKAKRQYEATTKSNKQPSGKRRKLVPANKRRKADNNLQQFVQQLKTVKKQC